MKTIKKIKWPLFIFSILFLLGTGGGLLYLGTRPPVERSEQDIRTVPVTAVILEKGTFTVRGEYAGRLEAVRDVTVTARVGGTIEEDLISEGDTVEEGQALYRIEGNSYRFVMEQAEAGLDLAEENMRKAQNFSRPGQIRRLEAIVAERETALKKAENDAARFDELHREGAVPLSRKEQVDLALASARAGMKIARENLEEAITGARAEDQAAAGAMVRQAEAAYRLARDNWEKRIITSPLEGTVAAKSAFAGDTVNPGSPVAEIVDLTTFKIRIGVSGADIGFFHPGKAVTVAPLNGREQVEAFVKNAGVKAEERTGSFPVIIELANPDTRGQRRFRAGTDISVLFTRLEAADVIAVPMSALIEETDRTWVFLAEGKTARRREVTTGSQAEGESVVTSGLEAGEVLVVVGQHQLRDGDSVELTFRQ